MKSPSVLILMRGAMRGKTIGRILFNETLKREAMNISGKVLDLGGGKDPSYLPLLPRSIELTRTEYLLLELLLTHPRQVLTRSAIFEHVWGYDFGATSNSLEVYIGYLRRKLDKPYGRVTFETIRGAGYRLVGST